MAGEVQYNQPVPSSGGKKGILVLVVIAVVLLIMAGVVLYMFISSDKTEQANTNTAPVTTEEDDGWPDAFYSYSGPIVSVNDDGIVINALADRNYVKSDREMSVLVDDQTSFVKITIPDRLEGVEPGQSGKLFERTEISKSSLKVGDMVTVIAYENIKGKTEFLAQKVELSN